jgi:uncharacterized protein
MHPTLLPVQKAERIDILDVLRGFALFGIFCVNMMWFRGSFLDSPLDKFAEALIEFFAQGKFYLIFSFLFGVGFAIQLERAERKGISPLSFYPRRLLTLLAFGLLHYFLIWDGDILELYAILGFTLLLFHKRSNKMLLLWVGTLLVCAPLVSQVYEHFVTPTNYDVESMVYSVGSYQAVVDYRIREFPHNFLALFVYQGPTAQALFLLGLYVGRKRFFEQLKMHDTHLRWGLLGGLACFVFGSIASITFVSAPGLACAYICGICVSYRYWYARKWLKPLRWLGRMALTNYLLQSLVCTTLFYGYGGRLYGHVGMVNAIALVIGIYVAQIFFSCWWLTHFQYGPMEWLWRCLTYGQLQPIRKTPAVPTQSPFTSQS